MNGSGSVVERYAYDPFGSASVYDASWGGRSSSNYAWVYMHQGGRYDATSGLYYFRNRDYSPTLGRWVQIDRLGVLEDSNCVRYLANSPVWHVDSFGTAEEVANDEIKYFEHAKIGPKMLIFDKQVEVDGDIRKTGKIGKAVGQRCAGNWSGPAFDRSGSWKTLLRDWRSNLGILLLR